MYRAPNTPLSTLPPIPRDPEAIRAAMALMETFAVWLETDKTPNRLSIAEMALASVKAEQTRVEANDRADAALAVLEQSGKGEIAKALYSWHAENV